MDSSDFKLFFVSPHTYSSSPVGEETFCPLLNPVGEEDPCEAFFADCYARILCAPKPKEALHKNNMPSPTVET